MNNKIEQRAKQLFTTGRYSVKEAFEQAEKELKQNPLSEFLKLFNK